MKKSLLLSFAAAMLLTGCSQDEVTPPDNGDNGELDTHYMSVNLISSDAPGSRATTGDYVTGSESENKVNSVRFYFFTDNGVAADVKKTENGYVNYYDWTPADVAGRPDGNNVEKILTATIVISTKAGDKLPQSVAAVLNAPENALGTTSKSLSELKAITRDYANGLYTNNNFVMFNSVYGSNGSEICASAITSSNLQKKEADAIANPVDIYVERCVAKVKVHFAENLFSENGLLKLQNKDKEDIIVDGEQVYLKIDGWSLTADTDYGRLVKSINPKWTSSWWNGPAGSHRSFWAINSDNAKNQYHTYPAIATAIGTDLYTNENALKITNAATNGLASNNTKVILKGSLVKSDGTTALTIVRHIGAYFADTYNKDNEALNLPALKRSILNQLQAHGNYYYYIVSDTERKSIDVDDLQIVIATQKPEEDSGNNCYVYAQLSAAAKAKTWYKSKDADAEAVDFAVINTALATKEIIDPALVWKNGQTYYYYEIIHNISTGDEGATVETKGVVRNHIYDTTVTSIAGLGTPVYDPGRLIYPEKPDPNEHYIAARINILAWRIVSNSYELEW